LNKKLSGKPGAVHLIDRHQPHETHQAAHTMATTLVVVALHMTSHLARTVPRRFQKLLVDDSHKTQVLRAFADWLIVKS
jgi:hypothetical protein